MPGPFPTLDEFKLSRFHDIDQRTLEVLARGYTYSGVAVSLSAASLIKYQTLNGLGTLLVSVSVEAADPLQDPLILPALLSASAFLSAVNTYLRSVYEAETALKSAIRQAQTQQQVEAVVDTR